MEDQLKQKEKLMNEEKNAIIHLESRCQYLELRNNELESLVNTLRKRLEDSIHRQTNCPTDHPTVNTCTYNKIQDHFNDRITAMHEKMTTIVFNQIDKQLDALNNNLDLVNGIQPPQNPNTTKEPNHQDQHPHKSVPTDRPIYQQNHVTERKQQMNHLHGQPRTPFIPNLRRPTNTTQNNNVNLNYPTIRTENAIGQPLIYAQIPPTTINGTNPYHHRVNTQRNGRNATQTGYGRTTNNPHSTHTVYNQSTFDKTTQRVQDTNAHQKNHFLGYISLQNQFR